MSTTGLLGEHLHLDTSTTWSEDCRVNEMVMGPQIGTKWLVGLGAGEEYRPGVSSGSWAE